MVDVRICGDAAKVGAQAAACGAGAIRAAIGAHGEACMVAATGASQFATLARLVQEPGIEWPRVTVFHLDEYVGLPDSHPASFRRYLQTRLLAPLRHAPRFIPVIGDSADLPAEAARLGALLAGRRVDVCFAGIGENGHLAFNDPPADFETEDAYLVVELDEACRRQQLGEGWFPTLASVPERAISMGIRQILRSAAIVLSVPDQRKAAAVRDALQGPVTPQHPASALQQHPNAVMFLDPPAASLLAGRPGAPP